MKILKLLTLLFTLFLISGCCFNNDCSGWVTKAVELHFVDKTTDKPLNIKSLEVRCLLDNAPLTKRDYYGNSVDSSKVRFDDGTFSRQGVYNGTVEVNKTVIGKFQFVLKAYPCCGDYPESGEVYVNEGNLTIKLSNLGVSGYDNQISGSRSAQFIVKL